MDLVVFNGFHNLCNFAVHQHIVGLSVSVEADDDIARLSTINDPSLQEMEDLGLQILPHPRDLWQ